MKPKPHFVRQAVGKIYNSVYNEELVRDTSI